MTDLFSNEPSCSMFDKNNNRKTEKKHFRLESQRFHLSPRPFPGQENRNWFNGPDEVKEKRNPSSLEYRVTVKLSADRTGPGDETATGL